MIARARETEEQGAALVLALVLVVLLAVYFRFVGRPGEGEA